MALQEVDYEAPLGGEYTSHDADDAKKQIGTAPLETKPTSNNMLTTASSWDVEP